MTKKVIFTLCVLRCSEEKAMEIGFLAAGVVMVEGLNNDCVAK